MNVYNQSGRYNNIAPEESVETSQISTNPVQQQRDIHNFFPPANLFDDWDTNFDDDFFKKIDDV